MYNALLENDPAALAALCEPFCMTRTGEIGPGKATWYEVPVFEPRDGAANCIGSVNYVLKGHDLPGAPVLDAARVAALERFEMLCREHAFAMDFRRGDIQFLNNGLVVHTRTAFEDWPEPERRRHLLRLWLSVPDMHPGVAWFRIWHNGVAVTDGDPRVRLSP